MSGEGRKPFVLGLAVIALLVAAANTVNVTTVMHDNPGYGVFAPIVWEGSSWATFILFVFIPWFALKMAPPGARPFWRVALIHSSALALVSIGHVAGFVLLRNLAYACFGRHYGYTPLTHDFPYEFRKDIVSYLLSVAIFWTVQQLLLKRSQRPAFSQSTTFDIRDGAKLTRVDLTDILAVTSAGNYVEFVLDDGRRLLMRSPLAATGTELSARGFVRTHRSWLVNAARMTALKPEGSGDYTIELGELTVPLSRRFPEALVILRGK